METTNDTNILRFSGHSDDCFICEIDKVIHDGVGTSQANKFRPLYDLDDCASGVTFMFRITDNENDTGLIVTGKYIGTWVIGISPLDEDYPLPDWPMDWVAEGYTTIMQVEVPSGVTIEQTKLRDYRDLKSPKWSENES